jgi:hypothetical protein
LILVRIEIEDGLCEKSHFSKKDEKIGIEVAEAVGAV